MEKTVTLVQKLKETRVKVRHKLSTRNPDEYLPVEQSAGADKPVLTPAPSHSALFIPSSRSQLFETDK